MSVPEGFNAWTQFGPCPGAPAAMGEYACQREGAKEVCKSCTLWKEGFKVIGVVAVEVGTKADPGSERAGQKTLNGVPVCCHIADRVDLLDNAPPELKEEFSS